MTSATSATSEGAQGIFSKITFLKSVCSNEKDEVCHSFVVEIFTKSLHRGGVTHFNFFFLDDGTNNRLKVSRTCDVNVIDKPQHCVCEAGKRISVFNSTHSNNEEDRVWRLQCAGIPKYGQMWVSFTHKV